MGYYIDPYGYPQPDRRSGKDRREKKDRRNEIRWEPGKEERRKGERRKSLKGGWNEGHSPK